MTTYFIMRTRSQRLRRERAGIQSSPPQHLPDTTRRPRTLRKKTPAVEPKAIDNSKSTTSEASPPPFRSVYPVPERPNSSERVLSAGEDDLKVSGHVPNTPHSPFSSTDGVPNPSHSLTSSKVATPVVKIAGPKEPYSLIYVQKNPSPEELASLRLINTGSLILLVAPTNRIPGLVTWIKERGEPCGHGLPINSSASTQVSASLEKRKFSDQGEITQYPQPHLTEPPADQEMSERAEGTESDTEIVTDTKYATRPRPRDWRTLPLQILAAGKLPNAKTPRDDQVPPLTVYERVESCAKDGSLQYKIKAVTYTSAVVVPPNPFLASKGPSEYASENPSSRKPNQATSAEHGLDTEIASECGTMQRECDSLQSGSVYANEPMLEPSFQAPQPGLDPVPRTPGRRWGFGGWIKSARSVANLIPGFSALSPLPEQSQTKPLPAAPVNPNVIKDRGRRFKNLSSRSKKPFRIMEDVQYSRTKRSERASARAQARAQAAKEDEDRKAKEVETLKEAQRKAEMATAPGQKRKRASSPDSIPNPKGCSYGMDLEYFGWDSSDEDEEPVIIPPEQPNKVRRTSGPSPTDRDNGLEISGTNFSPQGMNTVSRERASKSSQGNDSTDRIGRPPSSARLATPEANRASTPIRKTPSSTRTSHTTLPAAVQSLQSPLRALSGPSETTHLSSSVSEALRKARSKALQYQPRAPSSLGQSSRILGFSPMEALREEGNQSPVPSEYVTQPSSTSDTITNNKASNATNAASTLTAASLEFNASEKFLKAADKSVSAFLANTLVDSSGAGEAFAEAMANYAANEKGIDQDFQPSGVSNAAPILRKTAVSLEFNASEEFLKKADQSVSALHANTPVDSTGAGEAFIKAVTAYAVNGDGFGQEEAPFMKF